MGLLSHDTSHADSGIAIGNSGTVQALVRVLLSSNSLDEAASRPSSFHCHSTLGFIDPLTNSFLNKTGPAKALSWVLKEYLNENAPFIANCGQKLGISRTYRLETFCPKTIITPPVNGILRH